jgi:hypothetical protein
MGSENLVSAGNQQESLSREERKRWFLAGLVEGEGSVTLSIKQHPTAGFGVYVQPEFFIYQHKLRRSLLEMAVEYFGAGGIRPKQSLATLTSSFSPSSRVQFWWPASCRSSVATWSYRPGVGTTSSSAKQSSFVLPAHARLARAS